jgi:hypothetical protein
MCGWVRLRQLLLEMCNLFLSRRQVSALLGKLLLQLGWHVFSRLQITTACLAMKLWMESHAAAFELQWTE